MTSAAQHYSTLLAPIYVWMAGGLESALAQGEADVAALLEGEPFAQAAPAGRPAALDLGAGFGMHAIPLARRGYAVTAIDSSPALLEALRLHGAGLGIRAVEADLLDFRAHVDSSPALVLCLGDTLTHLQRRADVERLFAGVAEALAPGGRFVLTFRDYTHPPAGAARFIPVRSDADRILTCFLEEMPDHIRVHDLVHERTAGSWSLRVGSYLKLRLDPAWVAGALERAGLAASAGPGPRGMVRVVAARR